jgi:hypothetical protein
MSRAGERLEVGPEDVNAAGELVRRVGVHNQAKELIRSVAANFPPELVAAGSRRILGARSRTLDIGEVEAAAEKAFGEDYVRLEGAKVRGTEERPDKIIVNCVFRTESGRSARGILPYSEMTASQAAYEDAVKNGTVVFREDDPEANRRALEEAQSRIVELTKEVEKAKEEGGGDTPVEPPEPYQGYAEAQAKERVEAINDTDDPLTLAELLAVQADQEALGDKAQKTVVEAVEAKIAVAEAALRGEPGGDDSGGGGS